MNALKFILPFLAILLAFTSCSTGPDFERENIKDPKNQEFIPEIESFEVTLNSDKTVSLSWVDKSNFENGFLVAKTLGEQGEMEVLDTLSANSNSYTDHSKLLGVNTVYHVGAYRKLTKSADSTKFISKKLTFGEIQSFNSVSSGNEIKLSWSSTSPYIDHFSLKLSGKDKNSAVFDTINGDRSEYQFLIDDEIYFVDVAISALINNHLGELVVVHQKNLDEIGINFPIVTELTIVNEAIINISFEDHSVFDDKFVVFERSKPKGDKSYSSFIPLDTLNTGGEVFLSNIRNSDRQIIVKGLHQNRLSKASDSIYININPAPPNLTGNPPIVSLSPTEVLLNWEDVNRGNTGTTSTYHYDLSLYDADTKELLRSEILPLSQRQFTFDGLNTSNDYEFVLKTYNSPVPDPIKIEYQMTLDAHGVDMTALAPQARVEKSTFVKSMGMVMFSESDNGIPGVKLFDPQSETSETIADGSENHDGFDDSRIEDFTFTENLELVATSRLFQDRLDLTGGYSKWIFVTDRTASTPTYFKREVPINTGNDMVKLIGFSSESEIIFASSHQNDDLKIIKWDFRNGDSETLFQSEFENPITSYLFTETFILLGGENRLLVLDHSGEVVTELIDGFFGAVSRISKSNMDDVYYLLAGSSIYTYDVTSNNLLNFGNSDQFVGFFVVPEFDQFIGYQSSSMMFFDATSGEYLYTIQDNNRKLIFDTGYYHQSTKQFFLLHRGVVKTINQTESWVVSE